MNTAGKTTLMRLLVPLLVLVPVTVASASPESEAVLRATRVKVECKPSLLTAKSTTECTITVSDTSAGKKVPPAGAPTVTSSGPGTFAASACTLVAAVTTSKCSVRYTPARIGTGTHVITASFPANDVHSASTGSAEVGVTPPNDDRRKAEMLAAPPSSIDGTLVGATSSYSDPDAECASLSGTVWYRYDSRKGQRVAVRLKAHGKLDAAIAVFQQVRSQYRTLGCGTTDEKGVAGISFETARRGKYLVLVGAREGSARSTFRIDVFAPPVARPPGAVLPRLGARSNLDPLTKPEEAWSTTFVSGRTYRVNLAAEDGRCLSLSLFEPKTRSFAGARPLRRAGCGGYLVFTPGPDGGGRYSLLVEAESGRGGLQGYRLLTSLAGPDDTAPGITVANQEKHRGSLSGRGIDVVDLYRFEVSHLSDVTVVYQGSRTLAFDLPLVTSKGSKIDCACDVRGGGKLRTQLDEGEYFFAVRALNQTTGRYTVSLLVREITTTTVAIDGLTEAVSTPRRAVVLAALVTPSAAVGGPVRLQVDRFDPIEGWQFVRLFNTRVGSGGQTTVRWVPPALGRWRLHAVFRGSRAASPSKSRYAYLVVGSHPGA